MGDERPWIHFYIEIKIDKLTEYAVYIFQENHTRAMKTLRNEVPCPEESDGPLYPSNLPIKQIPEAVQKKLGT